MKPLSFYKCAGQRITRLYEGWSSYIQVDVEVPDERKTTQFNCGDWYVLDPYGDELPEKLRRRIFGKQKKWTVALNRADGRIATAHYFTEGDDVHCLFVEQWKDARLPPDYIDRIDALRGMKRPYTIHIEPALLQDFIDREIGYRELTEYGVVFTFPFGRYSGEKLEVQGRHFRPVMAWSSPEDEEVNRWGSCNERAREPSVHGVHSVDC